MHRKRIVGHIRTALLLLLVSACEADARGTERPMRREAIHGRWTVEIALASSSRPGNISPQRRILGVIALLPNASLDRVAGLAGPPTHSGSYTAHFRPFGFDLPGEDEVPALVARISAADTVEIVLQPERGDPVRMQGVLAGDSIVGVWTYYRHRGGGASGRFVMRRQ